MTSSHLVVRVVLAIILVAMIGCFAYYGKEHFYERFASDSCTAEMSKCIQPSPLPDQATSLAQPKGWCMNRQGEGECVAGHLNGPFDPTKRCNSWLFEGMCLTGPTCTQIDPVPTPSIVRGSYHHPSRYYYRTAPWVNGSWDGYERVYPEPVYTAEVMNDGCAPRQHSPSSSPSPSTKPVAATAVAAGANADANTDTVEAFRLRPCDLHTRHKQHQQPWCNGKHAWDTKRGVSTLTDDGHYRRLHRHEVDDA